MVKNIDLIWIEMNAGLKPPVRTLYYKWNDYLNKTDGFSHLLQQLTSILISVYFDWIPLIGNHFWQHNS